MEFSSLDLEEFLARGERGLCTCPGEADADVEASLCEDEDCSFWCLSLFGVDERTCSNVVPLAFLCSLTGDFGRFGDFERLECCLGDFGVGCSGGVKRS